MNLRKCLGALLCTLLVGNVEGQQVLLNNRPPANDGDYTRLGPGTADAKGMAFTIPAGQGNYILGQVTLRLQDYDASEIATLQLYNSGAGIPGDQVLVQFSIPTGQGTGFFDYVFTPEIPFNLAPTIQYWLVLSSGSGNFNWSASQPNISPDAIATLTDYLLQTSGTWGSSTTINTLTVLGRLVASPFSVTGSPSAFSTSRSNSRRGRTNSPSPRARSRSPSPKKRCSYRKGYKEYDDRDHFGDDLFRGTSIATAMAQCDANPNCVAFNSAGDGKSKGTPDRVAYGKCFYVKDNSVVAPATATMVEESASSASSESSNGTMIAAIAGSVAGAVVLVAAGGFLYWRSHQRQQETVIFDVPAETVPQVIPTVAPTPQGISGATDSHWA